MYSVSVDFNDEYVARKACELLSIAFPMLTFNFNFIPDIEFDSNITMNDWLNFTTNISLEDMSYNDYIKKEFDNAK